MRTSIINAVATACANIKAQIPDPLLIIPKDGSETEADRPLITNPDGYNFTVKLIDATEIRTPEQIPSDKFPCIQIVDGEVTSDIADMNTLEKRMTITVIGLIKDSAVKLADLRKFDADIEKAVCSDPSLNGLVLQIVPIRSIHDEGTFKSYGEIDVTFHAVYRQTYGDPETQG
jgi:hypothetical protein